MTKSEIIKGKNKIVGKTGNGGVKLLLVRNILPVVVRLMKKEVASNAAGGKGVYHILFGKMLSLPKKAVTNQHLSVTAFLSV